MNPQRKEKLFEVSPYLRVSHFRLCSQSRPNQALNLHAAHPSNPITYPALLDSSSPHYVYFQNGRILCKLPEFQSFMRISKKLWPTIRKVLSFVGRVIKTVGCSLARLNGNALLSLANQTKSKRPPSLRTRLEQIKRLGIHAKGLIMAVEPGKDLYSQAAFQEKLREFSAELILKAMRRFMQRRTQMRLKICNFLFGVIKRKSLLEELKRQRKELLALALRRAESLKEPLLEEVHYYPFKSELFGLVMRLGEKKWKNGRLTLVFSEGGKAEVEEYYLTIAGMFGIEGIKDRLKLQSLHRDKKLPFSEEVGELAGGRPALLVLRTERPIPVYFIRAVLKANMIPLLREEAQPGSRNIRVLMSCDQLPKLTSKRFLQVQIDQPFALDKQNQRFSSEFASNLENNRSSNVFFSSSRNQRKIPPDFVRESDWQAKGSQPLLLRKRAESKSSQFFSTRAKIQTKESHLFTFEMEKGSRTSNIFYSNHQNRKNSCNFFTFEEKKPEAKPRPLLREQKMNCNSLQPLVLEEKKSFQSLLGFSGPKEITPISVHCVSRGVFLLSDDFPLSLLYEDYWMIGSACRVSLTLSKRSDIELYRQHQLPPQLPKSFLSYIDLGLYFEKDLAEGSAPNPNSVSKSSHFSLSFGMMSCWLVRRLSSRGVVVRVSGLATQPGRPVPLLADLSALLGLQGFIFSAESKQKVLLLPQADFSISGHFELLISAEDSKSAVILAESVLLFFVSCGHAGQHFVRPDRLEDACKLLRASRKRRFIRE